MCFFQFHCGGSQPTAGRMLYPSMEINLFVGQALNLVSKSDRDAKRRRAFSDWTTHLRS